VSRDDLLARLARLDARDRAWLLGELPPILRRELIDDLAGDEPSGDTSAEGAPSGAAGGWETLDPQGVAQLLEGEPVWLVSAATRNTETRWRERLMQVMNSRRRHEIELADRTARPLNKRAADILLAACREKLASGAARPMASASRGGFSAMLERMKSRFA
jgi:hypothetical protein